MTYEHVHIAGDGGHHGVVYLGEDGRVHTDSSCLAEFAIHDINHRGLRPEDGQKLLDSIVDRLDPATLMTAHHCHRHECLVRLSR